MGKISKIIFFPKYTAYEIFFTNDLLKVCELVNENRFSISIYLFILIHVMYIIYLLYLYTFIRPHLLLLPHKIKCEYGPLFDL